MGNSLCHHLKNTAQGAQWYLWSVFLSGYKHPLSFECPVVKIEKKLCSKWFLERSDSSLKRDSEQKLACRGPPGGSPPPWDQHLQGVREEKLGRERSWTAILLQNRLLLISPRSSRAGEALLRWSKFRKGAEFWLRLCPKERGFLRVSVCWDLWFAFGDQNEHADLPRQPPCSHWD